MVPATGKPAGRIGNPPFEPSEEQRQTVKTYAVVLTQAQLAAHMGISEDTLQRHFRKEIDQATAMAVASIGSKLFKKASDGNLAAMIFFLKTRGKWNSRIEVTGAGGGPIKTFDLSRYSEEELRLLLPLIDQLLIEAGESPEGDEDAVSESAG